MNLLHYYTLVNIGPNIPKKIKCQLRDCKNYGKLYFDLEFFYMEN